MRVLVAAFLPALLLAACSSEPRYTQAQLNAIETRSVEASFEDTYNAASGALFDAGYIIAMSDREGGLLTGTQTMVASEWAAFWGTEPYYRVLAISIQIREDGPSRCFVRIKTQVNGRTRVDQSAIDEIWVLMQRQVLMTAPLAAEVDQGVSTTTSP